MANLYAYAWLVRVAFLYDVNLETCNLHPSISSWLISKILNSKVFFFQWTVTFSTHTTAVYVATLSEHEAQITIVLAALAGTTTTATTKSRITFIYKVVVPELNFALSSYPQFRASLVNIPILSHEKQEYDLA